MQHKEMTGKIIWFILLSCLIFWCRQVLLKEHDRIYMLLKADEQKGKTGRLKGKVDSVEEKQSRRMRR